jgi:hypothetical protein
MNNLHNELNEIKKEISILNEKANQIIAILKIQEPKEGLGTSYPPAIIPYTPPQGIYNPWAR